MKIKWFNPSQPQTLQTAVIIMYLNAVLAVLGGLLSGGLFISAFTILGVVGAAGIASEKKWAYILSVVIAIIPAALGVLGFLNIGPSFVVSENFINLLFQIALVVLLLHPMSRNYERIWFK